MRPCSTWTASASKRASAASFSVAIGVWYVTIGQLSNSGSAAEAATSPYRPAARHGRSRSIWSSRSRAGQSKLQESRTPNAIAPPPASVAVRLVPELLGKSIRCGFARLTAGAEPVEISSPARQTSRAAGRIAAAASS